MRLLAAEILKLRRRWASYIVLGLLIGLMALVYLLIGLGGPAGGPSGTGVFLRFPQGYGVINQFVFGLGSLLAVSYAAAIAGADWNWGVFRVIVARGESRARYVLVKFGGVAIFVLLGILLAYAAGIALTYLAAGMTGVSVGDPLAGDGAQDLASSLGLGSLVVLERAAIGFAVAMVLKSQLAGVVVGIVLYIGESILAAVVVATTFSGRFLDREAGPVGPEWFQYLPFSIGESVLSGAPAVGDDFQSLILRPVPLEAAIVVALLYLAAALSIGALSAERTQISG